MMRVVAWRERLDSSESRMLEASGQDNMTIKKLIREFIDRSENHAHLEPDSGFHWRRDDRATLCNQPCESMIKSNCPGTLIE